MSNVQCVAVLTVLGGGGEVAPPVGGAPPTAALSADCSANHSTLTHSRAPLHTNILRFSYRLVHIADHRATASQPTCFAACI